MLSVIPLRYGTAFKKAFSDPIVFSALVKAALDLDFTATKIEQEFSYKQAVARVNVAYDLYAEDTERRLIVELQHVRDDESYARFLYYHCLGLVEQIDSSAQYAFSHDVYTLVVLTRWPSDERLQFGRATSEMDPVTEEGRRLGVYRHRLVFVNARAPSGRLPVALRPLAALIDDSLDGEVDETLFNDPLSRRILERITRSNLDPDENARLKDETTWENARREERELGKQAGLDEGKKLGLRTAIVDLCELLGIELTDARRAHLDSLDHDGLDALRAALKQSRTWP